MKNEPGTLTKSWYLLGILIWRTQRTLTLEEQSFQIKKEVLTEINLEIDKAFNPGKQNKNNAQ